MFVTKRNNVKEKLNTDKIITSYQWAKQGLDVDIFEMVSATKLHFYDGISTSDIHEVGINTCRNLLSEVKPDYDKFGSRLLMSKLYNDIHNSKDMPILKDFITDMINKGLYINDLLNYTEDELVILNDTIVKDRDFEFSLSGLDQLNDKYIIKVDDKIVETPQLMFMAVAMGAFHDMKPEYKMSLTIELYNALSNFDISLPTPMMVALRTLSYDYASCITLRAGDTIDSWTELFKAIVKHTVASAGIGIDISGVSSIGDKVKGGKITHGGKVPLMRAIDALIQVATQNNRRGQGVTYVNFFDPEIITIFGLKSPRTEVTKRINDLKHGIKFNRLIYERARSGKDISLFSVREAPLVHKYFNSKDYDKFLSAYLEAERTVETTNVINARYLLSTFATDRFEVGIYYIMNIDECNSNTPYDEDICQSNICVEFIVPTVELSPARPDEPDIGVCILSNLNQSNVSLKQLPGRTKLLVYMLNNIMHRQVHPTGQANAFVKQYATLGIGIGNHSHWLVKNGYKYGDKAGLEEHNIWMEHFQYGLLSASSVYAKEFDAKISKMDVISYNRGVMPMDRYNKHVDELVSSVTTCDWDFLKKHIMEYGLANASLSMIPPGESSSVVGGMNNSIDPIKKPMTVKTTKGIAIKQLAKDISLYLNDYDLAYDREITEAYIKHIAVSQKWIDKSISANTYYNPSLYENEKVKIRLVLKDMYLAYRYGVKTLYYNNVMVSDENGQIVLIEEESCAGGACSV